MKPFLSAMRSLVVAGSAGLLPLVAFAQSPSGDSASFTYPSTPAKPVDRPGGCGPLPAMMPPPPRQGPGFPSMVRLPGLQLTDAQNDKAFAILYAIEPRLHAQMEVIRRSERELSRLAESDAYSDATLDQLVQANVHARAIVMQIRVRADHQIYALLTAEQRKQIERCLHAFDNEAKPECGGPHP